MRRTRNRWQIVGVHGTVVLLLALVSAATVFAQTVTGSLVGSVIDHSGAVLPGAAVVVTDIERGTTRESITSTEGLYTISSLAPGTYQVAITMVGFKKFVRDRVEVAINTTVRIDARLDVGGVTETVEVSGARPLLQTDRSDLTHRITTLQLESLPLSPDRNYQSLLELIDDQVDKRSFAPNFMILVSPVITMGEHAHAGSRTRLLGPNPPEQLVRAYSVERQVTPATPPAFVVHASDDKAVDVRNSLLFVKALVENSVSASLHLFPRGGHAIALRNNPGSTESWTTLCELWLVEMGFVQRKPRP